MSSARLPYARALLMKIQVMEVKRARELRE
jgi:hypothetical protein